VRGETAIGEGNFRGCGCAESGGDAGDDFEIDFGFAEGLDFFGGAAEEERVASFEADYDFVFGGVERRSELMSCWVRRRKPARLPTSIRSAAGGIRFRISGPIRESCRTTSALWRMRRALMVRSSGSPGPAPIRKTLAVLMGRGGAEEKLSSGAKAHLSIAFTPGLKPRPPEEKTF